jgi:hypothetical protein
MMGCKQHSEVRFGPTNVTTRLRNQSTQLLTPRTIDHTYTSLRSVGFLQFSALQCRTGQGLGPRRWQKSLRIITLLPPRGQHGSGRRR